MTATRKTDPPAIPAEAQSIYDGRHHLGWTVRRGKSFEAINFDRVPIGLFDTVLQARNALWSGEEVSHG
jgi:hypothetical protein